MAGEFGTGHAGIQSNIGTGRHVDSSTNIQWGGNDSIGKRLPVEPANVSISIGAILPIVGIALHFAGPWYVVADDSSSLKRTLQNMIVVLPGATLLLMAACSTGIRRWSMTDFGEAVQHQIRRTATSRCGFEGSEVIGRWISSRRPLPVAVGDLGPGDFAH